MKKSRGIRGQSGNVLVDAKYDPAARIHAQTLGAYRVTVSHAVANERLLLERLLIGVPGTFRENPTDEGAYLEICQTAIEFALADHPSIQVERDENGIVAISEVTTLAK